MRASGFVEGLRATLKGSDCAVATDRMFIAVSGPNDQGVAVLLLDDAREPLIGLLPLDGVALLDGIALLYRISHESLHTRDVTCGNRPRLLSQTRDPGIDVKATIEAH